MPVKNRVDIEKKLIDKIHTVYVNKHTLVIEYNSMGESCKLKKNPELYNIQIFKLSVYLQNINNFKFKWSRVCRQSEKLLYLPKESLYRQSASKF